MYEVQASFVINMTVMVSAKDKEDAVAKGQHQIRQKVGDVLNCEVVQLHVDEVTDKGEPVPFESKLIKDVDCEFGKLGGEFYWRWDKGEGEWFGPFDSEHNAVEDYNDH